MKLGLGEQAKVQTILYCKKYVKNEASNSRECLLKGSDRARGTGVPAFSVYGSMAPTETAGSPTRNQMKTITWRILSE